MFLTKSYLYPKILSSPGWSRYRQVLLLTQPAWDLKMFAALVIQKDIRNVLLSFTRRSSAMFGLNILNKAFFGRLIITRQFDTSLFDSSQLSSLPQNNIGNLELAFLVPQSFLYCVDYVLSCIHLIWKTKHFQNNLQYEYSAC